MVLGLHDIVVIVDNASLIFIETGMGVVRLSRYPGKEAILCFEDLPYFYTYVYKMEYKDTGSCFLIIICIGL